MRTSNISDFLLFFKFMFTAMVFQITFVNTLNYKHLKNQGLRAEQCLPVT